MEKKDDNNEDDDVIYLYTTQINEVICISDDDNDDNDKNKADDEKTVASLVDVNKKINKGTGAGGANTTKNGQEYEERTSFLPRLLQQGFCRYQIPGKNVKNKTHFYLQKDVMDGTKQVTYLTQGGLKAYFDVFFQKQLKRKPDEAFLIKTILPPQHYTLKILEKKTQSGPGSVDTKLMTGPGFVHEYAYNLGPQFTIVYAFSIDAFLKKVYLENEALQVFNKKHGIAVFFGEDADYEDKVDAWINL